MYSVRLTLAPVWNGDTVGSVTVRLVFDLPVRAGEPLFRIRTRSIDKPFAALDGELILSETTPGGACVKLPCETADCGEDMGSVRVFLPTRDASGETSLAYTVLPAPAGRNPVLDLGAEPGGLTGSGMTFLPAFFAEGPIRYAVRWDLSAMPKGSSAACSFGEGSAEREGDGNALVSAFYAVGAPLDCVRVGAFRYYWIRNPKLLETAVDAARIFSAESAFFSDDGGIYSIFTRHGTDCAHPGGTADARAYLWLYRDSEQIDRAALNFLFAHEMAHNWITAPDEPYGTCTWFVEGMAEFYSLVLPWRAGIVTAGELADELNRKAADYYENPSRSAPNEDCGAAFLADPEKTKVPYGRGFFFLLHTDAVIRKASDRRFSLDTLLFALLPRIADAARGADAPTASRRVNDLWIEECAKHIGPAAREDFAAMLSGRVWDPEPAAFGESLSVKAVPARTRVTGEACTGWRFGAVEGKNEQ